MGASEMAFYARTFLHKQNIPLSYTVVRVAFSAPVCIGDINYRKNSKHSNKVTTKARAKCHLYYISA